MRREKVNALHREQAGRERRRRQDAVPAGRRDVDEAGTQRWYAEHPQMWLSPEDLLDELRNRLGA
ncbi:MAG: hypothetical protein ACLGIV_15490 [Actinomycetes bacterium]